MNKVTEAMVKAQPKARKFDPSIAHYQVTYLQGSKITKVAKAASRNAAMNRATRENEAHAGDRAFYCRAEEYVPFYGWKSINYWGD